MSIQSATIKKFFREHFSGDNPIKAASSEKEKLEDMLRQHIGKIDNVKIDKKTYFYSKEDEQGHILQFSITNPQKSRGYYNTNYFDMLLDESGKLLIKYDYSIMADVSDINEIVSLIAACQKRIDRQNMQKIKRHKVRDFKTQAIFARIKKLAKEEKFDFYTENDTVKMKLFVRLAEKECIELHIPFNKFQEILPNLRSCILSLRELRNMGIRFKIKQISSYSRRSWISYDSLK